MHARVVQWVFESYVVIPNRSAHILTHLTTERAIRISQHLDGDLYLIR
jgi:hypothetical protein